MDDIDKGALAEEVVAELRRLRKGSGVRSANLQKRIGPRLGGMLELSDAVDVSTLRRELSRLLDSATVALSAERREQVLVALAVHLPRETNGLDERLAWLAGRTERQPRTVRRYVDQALDDMAIVLAERFVAAREGNGHVRYGWNVEQLSSTVTFTGPRPVLVERRRVRVSDRELRRITANLTLVGEMREGEEVLVDAREGCTVEALSTIGGKFLSAQLALPKPLVFGQTWEYEVSFMLPHRDSMGPFYGFAPLRPSRHFTAEVVFADPGDVVEVWALDGVPQVVIEDAAATRAAGRPIPLEDRRARIECDHLRQGLCYGLRWEWARV